MESLEGSCFFIEYSRVYQQKHEKLTDNQLARIQMNKIENVIIFKIKTWYYVQLLTSETMKLLGTVRNKITAN